MNIRIISFTDRGEILARQLAEALSAPAASADISAGAYEAPGNVQAMRCGRPFSLQSWTEQAFREADALVFVGACGIAVRAVAPFLRSKAEDPAVVVIDETADHVISLLSGHLGGANALTREIAALTGAEAVITTATDQRGVFAVDEWARLQGCVIPKTSGIRTVSGRLLAGGKVCVYSDWEISGELPAGIIFTGADVSASKNAAERTASEEELPAERMVSAEDKVPAEDIPVVRLSVWKSKRSVAPERGSLETSRQPLYVIPRIVSLGVGCRKGICTEEIENVFRDFCAETGLLPESVCQVCSVDRKAEEPGLLAFCRRHDWPLKTFSAVELSAAAGDFTASDFVREIIGVDNVCERSAVLGSGGALICKKYAASGVTMAAAAAPFAPDWRWRDE